MSGQALNNALQAFIAMLLLGAAAGGVKAYGEVEGLKVKVEAVETGLEKINRTLEQRPLCRSR